MTRTRSFDIRCWLKWLVSARSARFLLVALSVSGCLVDDDRCAKHQSEVGGSFYACVCDEGFVLSPVGYGCEACGAHEQAAAGKCVCEAGYARAHEGEACEATEGNAAGSECSDSQACGTPNSYCASVGGASYCTTQGCMRSDDCPENWQCDKSGSQSFCKMPPASLGSACDSSADCSEGGASYCETLMAHMCLVNECKLHPGDCPSQTVCCDLTLFVDTSLCLPKSTLVDGKCIGGMSPVAP